VTSPRSRYRPGAAPDYSHRFHAGNIGDVWKHCVLVDVLERARAAGGAVVYVETHAGEGEYLLQSTGEWTEGIGRLWDDDTAAAGADPVARYVALCRRLAPGADRPTSYPGSPAFARAVLGAGATLALWERDAAAYGRLAVHVGAGRAVVCQAASPVAGAGSKLSSSEAVTGLKRAEEARADLAKTLGVPSASIVIDFFRATMWPDSRLGCAGEAPSPAGSVRGFLIQLSSGGKTYEFHSDATNRPRRCTAKG